MALSNPTIAAGTGADVVRRQLTAGHRDRSGIVFRALLQLSLVVTMVVLGVLLVDVVTGGWGTLSTRLGDFLTAPLASSAETSGLSQAIRGTFYIGVFVLVFAVPIGIGAAIYLEEYAKTGRLARFVDLNIRNLAGVPSVVYGILGLTIFVKALGGFTGPGGANGRTVISAGLTLAILVLPIVIITSAEAIRAVPNGIREAGYGVGATRWEVVRSHVLPYAAPGILTGTVLSVARALGEAAPLILVGATTGFLTQGESYSPGSLQERFTALPTVITTWAGRPGDGYRDTTAAAIVILLLIVLVANAAAIFLRNHYEKQR
ncbi:MAG: phosphate ABC transporter permease PstA [Actinomycetota bacterium]|nr:phosphate ABC transporter permease PstA [Actinomycetota bacterium]